MANNHIDHIVLILDGSGSMSRHEKNLVKVVDSQIQYLAEKYKEVEQETRISVFWFSGRYEFECLVYDMDVLRVPSIDRLYRTANMTALVDASLRTIDDLLQVPVKYGDHAFLVYLLTDGLENHSSNRPTQLRGKLNSLPENWTFAGFVPDKEAFNALQDCGVPADNIRVWNTTSADGMLEVGTVIRTTTDQFKVNRAAGIRGTKSLFTLNTVSASDIEANLSALPRTAYSLLPVVLRSRADHFCVDNLGMWKKGSVFYELMKKETVQSYKEVAILFKNKVYSGQAARKMLGLPDYDVDVMPTAYPGYKIFVQSTAPNRTLIPGTQVLILH